MGNPGYLSLIKLYTIFLVISSHFTSYLNQQNKIIYLYLFTIMITRVIQKTCGNLSELMISYVLNMIYKLKAKRIFLGPYLSSSKDGIIAYC